MSGFTAADLEVASASVQQVSTLIHESSNSTAKDDAGTVVAHFLNWVEWDTTKNMFISTNTVPAVKGRGANGNCYMLRANFILDSMVPCDIFEETDDGYRVLCFYYMKTETLDFLKAYAADAWAGEESTLDPVLAERIRSVVTADGEIICDRVLTKEVTNKSTKEVTTKTQYGVWREIPKGANITAELRTFKYGDIERLSAPISKGQVPVRQWITCKLYYTAPSISVSHYFRKEDGSPGLRIDAEPIFKCTGISHQSATVTVDRFALLDRLARETATFAKPIVDVLDGKAQVPYSITYQMTPKAILYNGTVIRNVVPTDDQYNYLKEDDASNRLFSLYRDQYYNPDGSPFIYDIRFTAWPSECAAYNIDPNAWLSIMRQHQGLDTFVFANFQYRRTMDLDANNRAVLLARQANDPHGTYCYNVTAVFPNYAAYLPEHAIELTGDEVIDIFKKTTKKRLPHDGRFTVSMTEVEEGEEQHRQITFEASSCIKSTPLHFDGIDSPVICLGSGIRPVFTSTDASPLFTRTANRFYALLGSDMVPKSVFLEKAIAGDSNYQIFVVQNFDEEGEKKRV
jgi:hypothetical protein